MRTPHAPPKNRNGNGPAIRLPSNDVLRCGFLSCATILRNKYLPNSFRTSRNEEPPKEGKTDTGTRPLPSYERDSGFPKQCSEKPKHTATKSKKDSRTKKPANPNIQNLAFPNGYSHPVAAVLFALKGYFVYVRPLVRNVATAHRTGRGSRLSAAPLSASLRHPSPPIFTHARPHSPVLRRYLLKNETTQGARSGTTPRTAVKHP